jgi:hypothetical protein
MQEISWDESLSGTIAILSGAYKKEKLDAAFATSPIIDYNGLEVDTIGSTAKQKIVKILARDQEYFIRHKSIHYNRLSKANFETLFDTSDIIADEFIQTRALWTSWNINKSTKIYKPVIFYRNPEKVENFLALYPDILKMIKESWPDLIKYFGEYVSIILEVMVHNEEDAYEEIIAWIQSTDEIDDGLNKLDLFLDKWLIKQIETADDTFNFNIEFK